MGKMMNSDPLLRREDALREFAAVRRHSAYRAAVELGAAEIWMPRLWGEVPRWLEAHRVGFHEAVNNGGGKEGKKLGMIDRSYVSAWLAKMEVAFRAVVAAGWTP
jgi:hypothetical protein